MRYLGQDDLTRVMGVGYLGEVRQGPDGALYQYVQGVDGLGNPFGFWRRLKRWARRVVQKALPIAKQFATFVPGGTAALTAVTPVLKQAGVAGYDGLGALYQAPDGSVYQMQGISDDDDLRGLDEDEELRGLDEDEELRLLRDCSQCGDLIVFARCGANRHAIRREWTGNTAYRSSDRR